MTFYFFIDTKGWEFEDIPENKKWGRTMNIQRCTDSSVLIVENWRYIQSFSNIVCGRCNMTNSWKSYQFSEKMSNTKRYTWKWLLHLSADFNSDKAVMQRTMSSLRLHNFGKMGWSINNLGWMQHDKCFRLVQHVLCQTAKFGMFK